MKTRLLSFMSRSRSLASVEARSWPSRSAFAAPSWAVLRTSVVARRPASRATSRKAATWSADDEQHPALASASAASTVGTPSEPARCSAQTPA